ncbi:unnamed protein product [Rhizophagus irregularis]|nr:unnamed protein product [Rhizophagus irregularis]CAB5360127.1 unnamed protein product [Rhizophagus irregularis]
MLLITFSYLSKHIYIFLHTTCTYGIFSPILPIQGLIRFFLLLPPSRRRLVRTSYSRATHNIKDIEENQYDKIVLYLIFFLSLYNSIPMFLYFIIANFLTRKVFFRVNFGGEGEERITMWGLSWPCDALVSPMDFGVIYISFALSVISIVFYN